MKIYLIQHLHFNLINTIIKNNYFTFPKTLKELINFNKILYLFFNF